MRSTNTIREEFMNGFGMILPRVGGGVGGRGGLGVGDLFQDQVNNVTVGAALLALGRSHD